MDPWISCFPAVVTSVKALADRAEIILRPVMLVESGVALSSSGVEIWLQE